MTSGDKLKVTLGLSSFRTVWVSRLILPHTQKVLMVYYNSLRKTHDFPKNRCKIPPFTGMAYSGKDLSKGDLEKPAHTPLIGIELWNGDLNNYIVVAVDIAYSFRVSPREFDRLPESKTTAFKEVSILYPKGLLFKEVTIADLNQKDNISDLTKKTTNIRQNYMKGANYNTKLIDLDVNTNDGSITFKFLTEATEGIYPKDHTYKDVDPKNSKINVNKSKTYELWIQVMKVFGKDSWLSTYPNKDIITMQDIKDILKTSDVRLWSNDVSWTYQGFQYWNDQIGSSIFPQNIKPQRWDKYHGDGEAFLTKHFAQLFKQINFFSNIMASKATKALRDRKII